MHIVGKRVVIHFTRMSAPLGYRRGGGDVGFESATWSAMNDRADGSGAE